MTGRNEKNFPPVTFTVIIPPCTIHNTPPLHLEMQS